MKNEKKLNLKISRRDLLVKGGGALGLMLGSSAIANQLSNICGLTPEQDEGPFYPVKDQADKDSDLTYVNGKQGTALGEVVRIVGVVRDENCQPISGGIVEIWQANKHGRYNHPLDGDSPRPIDPNFQHWGISRTDSEGNYGFKTIIPGSYPASPTWIRPSHIHFKVHKLGYHELITQMYFRGARYNVDDRILRSLSPQEQELVIVDFIEEESDSLVSLRVGRFDLALRSVQ